MSCPKCGEAARCKGFRQRSAISLFGELNYQRHYYHCVKCRACIAPLDGILKLGERDLTLAAQEVTCIAGLEDSFATGAERLLSRMAGLHVSESTVQRTTEEVGKRLADKQHEGGTFGEMRTWAWHKDAQGKTVGYISLDGTGVGQQGPGGKKAEGRMVLIGMVYNPIPEESERWANPLGKRPEWQARYVAQLRSLDELATPLRRQAGQVGLDHAERWIGMSDGGAGFEDFLKSNFPRVEVVIVDFYHVAEYLGKLSKVLFPGRDDEAEAWRKAKCEQLKLKGGSTVLEDLEKLSWQGKPRSALQVRDEVLTYFENQKHRMDYPTYLAKGWQIGSGAVESACKTVIGERMKGGGMRWGEDGADGISHLRALFCSAKGPWEAFWAES